MPISIFLAQVWAYLIDNKGYSEHQLMVVLDDFALPFMQKTPQSALFAVEYLP